MASKMNKAKHISIEALKTTGILLGTAGISKLLFQNVENQSIVSNLYILATIITAMVTSGYVWGILSSLGAVMSIYFSDSRPYSIGDFGDEGFVLIFVEILCISLIINYLTEFIKEQRVQSRIKEEKTQKLDEINSRLHVATGRDTIIALALEVFSEFTNSTIILYMGDPLMGEYYIRNKEKENHDKALTSYHESFIAHMTYEKRKIGGFSGEFGLKSVCTYLPFISDGESKGVIGVFSENPKPLRKGDITFLNLIVSQVVISVERQEMADQQQATTVESEKEKTRANLLRALSHDIRTPLTGIIGASSALIENKELLEEKDKDKLIKNINDDSNWLLHMAENLLSVTRIHEESATVTKHAEPLEEVVAQSISLCKKRYPDANILVKIPDEFFMVPMDATLIEQVILNLLENAIKYAQSLKPIELYVENTEEKVVFHIIDHGIGIPKEKMDKLFEGFSRKENNSSDASKGMGIGLSICKTIIHAHGGNLIAVGHENSGTEFIFELPL